MQHELPLFSDAAHPEAQSAPRPVAKRGAPYRPAASSSRDVGIYGTLPEDLHSQRGRLNYSRLWRLSDKRMPASRRCLLHADGTAGPMSLAAPLLVIPSAAEGSAVRLSPYTALGGCDFLGYFRQSLAITRLYRVSDFFKTQ